MPSCIPHFIVKRGYHHLVFVVVVIRFFRGNGVVLEEHRPHYDTVVRVFLVQFLNGGTALCQILLALVRHNGDAASKGSK